MQTMGDFLESLTNHAKEYRKDSKNSLIRNNHMNEIGENELVDQHVIDAILVDFINYIAAMNGGDYGLTTTHLKENNEL